MRKIFSRILIVIAMSSIFVIAPAQPAFAVASAQCQKNSFFGLPTWYKYLDVVYDSTSESCVITNKGDDAVSVGFLIGLAVFEILLAIAGLLAVVFVTYGGYKFIIAQGEPDKIAGARKTILNALIGLVIAVLASQIVAFIARILTT
jgi:Type IV secretion system pilin